MPETKRVVLSVDWDYFFPLPDDPIERMRFYDWCHLEVPLFIQPAPVWVARAAAFLAAGRPLPGTSGEEHAFWKRFKFAPDARMFYADSHSKMVTLSGDERYLSAPRRSVKVISYDAHHDGGYEPYRDVIDCASWTLAWPEVEVRYPPWRRTLDCEAPPLNVSLRRRVDKGSRTLAPISDVFVCRSGAWTPPWVDRAFFEFLVMCPVEKIQPVMDDCTQRLFRSGQARVAGE